MPSPLDFLKRLGSLQADKIHVTQITVGTAGTPVQFATVKTPCDRVDVSADTDAGSIMAVGDSSVDAVSPNKNGLMILPGNAPHTIYINDLSKLYVDAETSGGRLCIAYYTRD